MGVVVVFDVPFVFTTDVFFGVVGAVSATFGAWIVEHDAKATPLSFLVEDRLIAASFSFGVIS